MASPSVTNTFTSGEAALASEVNQNFTDVINGITDGTKDLSISALTCAGTATLNGAVTLGNATGDDITITGRVASDIDPKTAATYTLGDATQTWQALYLDGATDGGAIYFDAGSTEFIKSTADGSELDIAGFTTVDFVDAATLTFPATTAFNDVVTATWGQCTAFNIGDGTDASVTATIDANTGDAALVLQVNNASANAWKIINDNSDGDDLKFQYNGTSYVVADASGGGLFFMYDSGGDVLSFDPTNIASGTTPAADRIYPNLICKAWANTASGATINDGVNLTVSSGGTGNYDYTFRRAMASANFVPVATAVGNDGVASLSDVICSYDNLATSGFTINTVELGSTAFTNWAHVVAVFGDV